MNRLLNRSIVRKCVVAAVVVALNAIPAHVAASTTSLNWEQVPTNVAPPGREYAVMSYDSLRGRTVLFGGDTVQPGSSSPPAPYFADTWEWDGGSWVNRTPAISPPAVSAGAMAYDSNRGVSVLFGGSPSSGYPTAGTWEWDGISWTQRTLAVSPTGRAWHAMAYDSAHGQVVLFGGNGGGNTMADTWTYDGTHWLQLFPATSPPARFGATMAFDSVRSRIVLFGGYSNGSRLNDTWEWDGITWTQRVSIATPQLRAFTSMVFDSHVGKTILFGGNHLRPLDLGPINDTWQWDGNQWTELWPDAAPIARLGQTMAFDSARARSVVFGGTNASTPPVFYTDTWELGTGITTPAGNPDLKFTQASSFRPTVVGTTSDFAAVRFVSSGTGPVLISSMTMSSDFAISGTDCPLAPNPLAATSVCIVLVTFTPTAVGTRSGTLVLNNNGPVGSVSVTLSAEGRPIPTSLTIAPTSATYGGTATVLATLTANGSPLPGASVNFTISNGSSATATTDSTGVATWSGASVAGLHAGPHYGDIQATFAGDDTHLGSSSGAFGGYLLVGQPGSLAYAGDFYVADTAGVRVAVVVDQRSPASDPQFIDFSVFPVWANFDVVGPGGSSTVQAQIVDDTSWSSTGRGVASATLPPLADGAYTVTARVLSYYDLSATRQLFVSDDSRVAIVSSPSKGAFVSGAGAIPADPSANTADPRGYFGLQLVPSHPLRGSMVYAYRANMAVGGGVVRDVDVWVTSTDVTSVSGAQSTGHFSVTFVDSLTGQTYSALGFAGGTFTLSVVDGGAKSVDTFGLVLNRPDGSVFHSTAALDRRGKVQQVPIALGSIMSNL